MDFYSGTLPGPMNGMPVDVLSGADPLGRDGMGSLTRMLTVGNPAVRATAEAVAAGVSPTDAARAYFLTNRAATNTTINGQLFTRSQFPEAGAAVSAPPLTLPSAPASQPGSYNGSGINPATNGTNAARMTADEYADVLLQIDQQAALEATYLEPTKAAPEGRVLHAILQEVRTSGELTKSGLGSFFSSAASVVGSAVKAVVSVPVKIVQTEVNIAKKVTGAAANSGIPVISNVAGVANKLVGVAGRITEKVQGIISKATTLPLRLAVMEALTLFKGPARKAFAYTLIPDGAPILAANPKVAAKRTTQLAALKSLTDYGSFEPSYLLKHIRNSIVAAERKTPEQLISEWSKGEAQGLDGTESGLGDAATWAAVATAAAGLLAAVPAVIAVIKGGRPSTGDFNQPTNPAGVNPAAVQPGQETANYPSGSPSGDGSMNKALLIGGGVAAAGLVVFLATRKK